VGGLGAAKGGCGELGEGSGEGVAGDVFVVDLDQLEERLVEEPALGVVALEVGGLDVVGEVEGEIECLDDRVLVDLVASEELVGGDPLSADALLFLGEDVVADRVRLVGVEEFPFLARSVETSRIHVAARVIRTVSLPARTADWTCGTVAQPGWRKLGAG